MNIIGIKLLYYKFLLRYFRRFTRKDLFNCILSMEGFEIGEGTFFYSPETIVLDRQRPWMLKIGRYCKITRGVTILTHDYSRSVIRRVYGEIIGEAKMTTIGDNVFIGMNSIVLMGSHIGSNVIIGAGSVVCGTIPNNVVVAGNPAKVIRTLDTHYSIRKSSVLKEAKIWFESYKERYGVYPSENNTGPFFPLYTKRESFDYKHDRRLLCNGDNMDEVIEDFKNSKPIFNSYESFLDYIKDI